MPQASPDPFRALGLQPSFDLDRAAVERAYLARAAAAHPDLNQGEADDSATLNDARKALLNSESRANALLAALGGPSPSEHKALPYGFLVEIMQTRLEIEQAAEESDPEALARWKDWADDQRSDYINRISAAFAETDRSPASLAAIRETLNAWRYIERLIEQLPSS